MASFTIWGLKLGAEKGGFDIACLRLCTGRICLPTTAEKMMDICRLNAKMEWEKKQGAILLCEMYE